MTSKKIDLGEYVLNIYHNDTTGELRIDVYDEGGDIIDFLKVTNDEDEEIEEDTENDGPFKFN